VIEAQIGVANSYLKKWEYVKAETAYLKILTEHENETDVCEVAAKGLLDIYTAQNKPTKAADVVERYSCIDYSEDEKENLFYGPALQAYLDTNYDQAVEKFSVYVDNFMQSGKHIGDAYYYLGDSYLHLTDTLSAIPRFESAINSSSGSYKEYAASRVSNYYYNLKSYSRALEYYQILEQLGSTPSSINVARLGIMRSAFFLKNYELSKEYALFVLENSSLTETIKSEANYALGLSCYYLGSYEEAMTPLEWLVANMTTFMGSEAQFTLAQIHFNQEDLSGAKSEIDQLLKMKPSYDLWIAKGLILKSRILIKEGDLFQSEQNLKAVIEHYPNTDDGILEEANALWDDIMILKNPPIEEPEDDNETKIEIDED
jgi:TolA-binding protein